MRDQEIKTLSRICALFACGAADPKKGIEVPLLDQIGETYIEDIKALDLPADMGTILTRIGAIASTLTSWRTETILRLALAPTGPLQTGMIAIYAPDADSADVPGLRRGSVVQIETTKKDGLEWVGILGDTRLFPADRFVAFARASAPVRCATARKLSEERATRNQAAVKLLQEQVVHLNALFQGLSSEGMQLLIQDGKGSALFEVANWRVKAEKFLANAGVEQEDTEDAR